MSHSHPAVAYIKPQPVSDISSVFTQVFMALASFFITLFILTNLIAGKYFLLWGWPLSCSVLVYPFTFLISSVVIEIYGPRWARLLIFAGLVASLATAGLVWMATQLPTAPDSPLNTEVFNKLFGPLPGITVGSLVGYLITQLIAVQVFELLRGFTKGKYLGARYLIVVLIGQILDTLIVVTIAWVLFPLAVGTEILQPITGSLWMKMMLGQCLFKAIMAFLGVPCVYMGVHFISRQLANKSDDLISLCP